MSLFITDICGFHEQQQQQRKRNPGSIVNYF